MLGKELKLLSRDRNYLVQTLLMPLLILGMQIYLGTSQAWQKGASLRLIAVTGFGMASYAMVFSAFGILTTEGQALWLWYTFPHRLSSLILQKRRPWLFVAGLYWLLFALYGFVTHAQLNLHFFWYYGLALIGIVFSVVLATALGVFSFNPQSLETGRKVHVSYLYLYMILASSYGAFFLTRDHWNAVVGVILSILMALAFWQKAEQHLPYLLDPTEAPPTRVSLADALMASYGFFVIEALVLALGGNILLAFSVAGAAVFILTRFYYWSRDSLDVPRFFETQPLRAVAWGAVAGLACAQIAYFYLDLIDRFKWFSGVSMANTLAIAPDERWTYGLLAVVAAPFCEEFIYRGLALRGLEKSMPRGWAIVLSAVLFACIHPPFSVAPVFILGLVSAWLYDRRGALLASLTAHSVYNFCVIVVPWLMSGQSQP